MASIVEMNAPVNDWLVTIIKW